MFEFVGKHLSMICVYVQQNLFQMIYDFLVMLYLSTTFELLQLPKMK